MNSPESAQDWTPRTTCLIFWSAVVLHSIAWIWGPTWVIPNYQPDTIEMMVSGQNWVISTLKHPSLNSWVVEVISRLTGHAECAPYLAAQLAAVLAVWGVWKFAERCVSRKLAVVAALAALGFFSLGTRNFNYDNLTFLRTFWVLSGYFLLCAVQDNRLRDWFLCGVCIAGGLYCHALMVLHVLTVLVYMGVDSEARKYWRTWGPYLATLSSFLLVLPLILWTVRHQFPQLTYGVGTFVSEYSGVWGHLYYAGRLLVSQLLLWLTVLLPLLPLLGFHWRWNGKGFWSTPAERLMTTFVVFPLLVEFLISLFAETRVSIRWSYPIWQFLPVWLLCIVNCRTDSVALRRGVWWGGVNLVLLFVVPLAVVAVRPAFSDRHCRLYYPGKEVTRLVETAWKAHTNAPFRAVRGDTWVAGCVNVYSPSHPQVWSTLWTDEETFRKTGGMLVWIEPVDEEHGRMYSQLNYFGDDCFYTAGQTAPTEWLEKFPTAQVLESVTLEHATRFPIFPVRVGMAYVPPESP